MHGPRPTVQFSVDPEDILPTHPDKHPASVLTLADRTLGAQRMRPLLIATAVLLLATKASANDLARVITAIEQDDRGAIVEYIRAGGDVDARAPNGRFGGSPLLHLAARLDATESATALIDAGARLNSASRTSGATALHAAAMRGNADLALRLLTAGADPNVISHLGEVPLHNAVVFGQQEVVTVLLEHGADPNFSQSEQGPPIMGSARTASVSLRRALGLRPYSDTAAPIIATMIAHGADVDVSDAHGTTLLDYWMHRVCAERDVGGESVVNMLLDSGALLDQEKVRGFLDIGRSLGNEECEVLAPLTGQRQL